MVAYIHPHFSLSTPFFSPVQTGNAKQCRFIKDDNLTNAVTVMAREWLSVGNKASEIMEVSWEHSEAGRIHLQP